MQFSAEIKLLGINPYVTPPKEVLEFIFQQAKKETSPIPVKGKLNGVWFMQSLVRYQGDWRLYINGQMAKNAKLEYKGSVVHVVGQTVDIHLMVNRNPFVHRMNPSLKKELDKNDEAKKTFDALTPGRKKEILRYLASLKTKESLQRNVERVISHLTGKETDGLYALMHKEKISVK